MALLDHWTGSLGRGGKPLADGFGDGSGELRRGIDSHGRGHGGVSHPRIIV